MSLVRAIVDTSAMVLRSSLAVFTLAALVLTGGVAWSARDADARESLTDPPFPVRMSAKVVKRTPPSKLFGDRLLFKYCFAEPMPRGRHVRPAVLWLGVDNPNDHLTPLVLQSPITKACGSVDQPTGHTKRPFFVVVSVGAPSGNMSSVVRLKPVFG